MNEIVVQKVPRPGKVRLTKDRTTQGSQREKEHVCPFFSTGSARVPRNSNERLGSGRN